jgi:hypothetical protein
METYALEIRQITDKDLLDRWADDHIFQLYHFPALRRVLRQKRNELRNVANIRAEAMRWINTVKS